MKYGMLLDLNRCIDCGGCVMACRLQNSTPRDIYWCKIYHKEVGEYPNARLRWIPRACMHCQNAPCVKTCPTGASYYDGKGRVLIDITKCIGCRSCVNSCPYAARHYNFVKPENDSYWEVDGYLTPYEKARTVKEHVVGTTEKCTWCTDLVAAGHKPACVQTCVGKARVFGDLDDPASELNEAIANKKARTLHEEFGTQPNFFYAGSY